jgi:hypothetical protein
MELVQPLRQSSWLNHLIIVIPERQESTGSASNSGIQRKKSPKASKRF